MLIEDINISDINNENIINDREELFDEEIINLSASIKNNGLIEPIVVKRNGEGFKIVCGRRRVLAHKFANIQTIKAIVKDFKDSSEELLFILDENFQRKNLNKFEDLLLKIKIIFIKTNNKIINNDTYENITNDSMNFIIKMKNIFLNMNSKKHKNSFDDIELFENFKKTCKELSINFHNIFNNAFLFNCDETTIKLLKSDKINLSVANELYKNRNHAKYDLILNQVSKSEVKMTLKSLKNFIKSFDVKNKQINFDKNKFIKIIEKVDSEKGILYLKKIEKNLLKFITLEDKK